MLNQAENTEYIWLTIDTALERYKANEMAMFAPQVTLLLLLHFQAQTYAQLKRLV